jgi:hypothetical protein
MSLLCNGRVGGKTGRNLSVNRSELALCYGLRHLSSAMVETASACGFGQNALKTEQPILGPLLADSHGKNCGGIEGGILAGRLIY